MNNVANFHKSSSIIIKASSYSGDFRSAIRANARGLWMGAFDYFGFISNMTTVLRVGITRAFHEGAGRCGITPSELTETELSMIETEINGQIQYLVGFGNYIQAHSKKNKGKLSPILSRADMWANHYEYVASLGMEIACRDRKMEWVVDPAKESCSSCLRLNGRVYRASIWLKYDLRPRMHRLACKGYRCGCKFIETTKPATPGRPPQI